MFQVKSRLRITTTLLGLKRMTFNMYGNSKKYSAKVNYFDLPLKHSKSLQLKDKHMEIVKQQTVQGKRNLWNTARSSNPSQNHTSGLISLIQCVLEKCLTCAKHLQHSPKQLQILHYIQMLSTKISNIM